MTFIKAFSTPAEALGDLELRDKDIAIVPKHGVIAVCVGTGGERTLWSLTRHDAHGIHDLMEIPSQSRWADGGRYGYATTLKAALAVIGEQPDTVGGWYNPRYRLHDGLIPGRTRDRGDYRAHTHNTDPTHMMFRTVWWAEVGPQENFVGWVMYDPDPLRGALTPLHRDGHALAQQDYHNEAVQELVSYDLAATATPAGEPQQAAPAEPPATPVEYEPNMED